MTTNRPLGQVAGLRAVSLPPEAARFRFLDLRKALEAKEAGEARVILFNLCGHGHFDLSAYERHLAGDLEDYEYPREKVEAALAGLPAIG